VIALSTKVIQIKLDYTSSYFYRGPQAFFYLPVQAHSSAHTVHAINQPLPRTPDLWQQSYRFALCPARSLATPPSDEDFASGDEDVLVMLDIKNEEVEDENVEDEDFVEAVVRTQFIGRCRPTSFPTTLTPRMNNRNLARTFHRFKKALILSHQRLCDSPQLCGVSSSGAAR
jgi:hypothetical protein